MTFEIIALKDFRGSINTFDCGIEALNEFLEKYAKQNDKMGIGRTYLLVNSSSRVLGYYTISMAQIEFHNFPETTRKRLPKYPIPCARIGRLAVHKEKQGNGLGAFLLMNAIERIWRVSNEIALYAVLVDAKNESARSFYEKYGFLRFDPRPLALYLPITTIESLMQKV